jgi:hypothetical protein
MPPHSSSSACAVEGASAQLVRTHSDENKIEENKMDEPRLIRVKGLPQDPRASGDIDSQLT